MSYLTSFEKLQELNVKLHQEKHTLLMQRCYSQPCSVCTAGQWNWHMGFCVIFASPHPGISTHAQVTQDDFSESGCTDEGPEMERKSNYHGNSVTLIIHIPHFHGIYCFCFKAVFFFFSISFFLQKA